MNLLNYNLHPIFVHFPIALLSLYSFFEFISFGSLRRNQTWIIIKAMLVCLGGISLLVVRQLGSVAKHEITNPDVLRLVRAHEQYANYSTAVFGIIATFYVLVFVKLVLNYYRLPVSLRGLFSFLFVIQDWYINSYTAKAMALLGLALLTIAGALGGSIIYSPTIDPFTNFIYKTFFH